MRAQDIREFLQRRPFQPLRFTLTEGRDYEVRHPDLLMVDHSSVIIGVPSPGGPDAVFDRAVHVSLLHIMQAESLAMPISPQSN